MSDINCKETINLNDAEYSRVQSRGIQNYDFTRACKTKDLDKIKSITGPFMYGEYTFAGRNIHLFGEIHNFSQPCGNHFNPSDITLPGFLHSLFTEQKNIKYDLLVEYPLYFDEIEHYLPEYTKTIKRSRNQIVSSTATSNAPIFALFYIIFNKYFGKTKDITDYPNTRFHYIDPRDLLTFQNLHSITDRYGEGKIDISIDKYIDRMEDDIIYIKNLIDNLPFIKHIDNIDTEIVELINIFITDR